MSEHTRRVAQPHLRSHDLDVLADDVVYVDVGRGLEYVGRDGAAELMAVYNAGAFVSTVEVTREAYAEGTALMEFVLRGEHRGEWDGLAPTGAPVEVPGCLVARVRGDRVERVHLYLPIERMREQLRQAGAAS